MKKMVQLTNRRVAPIGLGTWHMGDNPKTRQEEIRGLQTGLANGLQVIDTAEMYGDGRAEKLVGEAIKESKREDVYLISKFFPHHGKTPYLETALENSLTRLGVDYLDLYLLHWRGSIALEETVAALEGCVKAGKIKGWGVSNFDTADILELQQTPMGQHCQANEDLYNIATRGIEYDLLPVQRKLAIPLIAYTPLAQGDRFGQNILKNPVLIEIARDHDQTVFQVMLSWAIRDGQTIAIPQSSNEKHVLQNIEAINLDLTTAELQAIDTQFPAPSKKEPLAII